MNKPTLTVLTGNKGKKKEYQALLQNIEFDLQFIDVDLDEIQSLNIETVAAYKMQQAFLQNLDGYLIIDDTSLEIPALGCLPGVFIKWFIQSINLDSMYELVADKDKSAEVKCCICLGNTKTKDMQFFTGNLLGEIVKPKTIESFGWDPLFLPKHHSQTFAEMDFEEKNKISHRTLAVEKLMLFLKSQKI